MSRYISLVMFLVCCPCIDAADLPKAGPYILESVVHTRMARASDMALAPNGTNAVTCMDLKDDGFLKFDAVSGELLSRHLKRDFNPQKVFWLGNRLLLLTDTRKSPEFRVLDAMSFEVLRESALADWRLYRITSATLTSDGAQIWIGTMPTESSRYGSIDSALFVLDATNGDCRQIAGPPPDKGSADGFGNRRFPWMVCADDAGGIVAIDPKKRSVIAYSKANSEPRQLVQLDFAASAVPRKCKQYLPIVGVDCLHVIDMETGKSIGKIAFKGSPLAVCVDERGTTAFVSTLDTSTLLQFDLLAMKSLQPIDLSRPKGVPGIADATRGKDVSDIVELRWASNPDRIIAFGYDGYIFITATLEKEERTEQPAAQLQSDRARSD